jgi:hypothetical protein
MAGMKNDQDIIAKSLGFAIGTYQHNWGFMSKGVFGTNNYQGYCTSEVIVG